MQPAHPRGDDDEIRASLRRGPLFAGFDVALAANGAGVLGRGRNAPPDRFVLDAMMPGLDGQGVPRRLRAADGRRPAVMLIPHVAGPDGVAKAAAQDTAEAGDGGTADASASGGAIDRGDVNSGGNTGSATTVGDVATPIDGGGVVGSPVLALSADGGTAIADAGGENSPMPGRTAERRENVRNPKPPRPTSTDGAGLGTGPSERFALGRG